MAAPQSKDLVLVANGHPLNSLGRQSTPCALGDWIIAILFLSAVNGLRVTQSVPGAWRRHRPHFGGQRRGGAQDRSLAGRDRYGIGMLIGESSVIVFIGIHIAPAGAAAMVPKVRLAGTACSKCRRKRSGHVEPFPGIRGRETVVDFVAVESTRLQRSSTTANKPAPSGLKASN